MFLAWGTSGEFRLRFLLPGIFVWASVSARALIPPLLFALVAMLAHHRRPPHPGTGCSLSKPWAWVLTNVGTPLPITVPIVPNAPGSDFG